MPTGTLSPRAHENWTCPDDCSEHMAKKITELTVKIERRQKYINGLQGRRQLQIEQLLNFRNEKDDHYFLTALHHVLNRDELAKEYEKFEK